MHVRNTIDFRHDVWIGLALAFIGWWLDDWKRRAYLTRECFYLIPLMRIMALVFSEISCIHCIINRADSCNKVREAESIEWASRVFSDELIQYSDVWSGSRSHQFIHGSSSLKPKEVWWCDPKFGKWNETDRFCPPDICYAGSNIMMRLDSKRALGRNHIINGVNFNMHQNASLIFVWSPCGPAFKCVKFPWISVTRSCCIYIWCLHLPLSDRLGFSFCLRYRDHCVRQLSSFLGNQHFTGDEGQALCDRFLFLHLIANL